MPSQSISLTSHCLPKPRQEQNCLQQTQTSHSRLRTVRTITSRAPFISEYKVNNPIALRTRSTSPWKAAKVSLKLCETTMTTSTWRKKREYGAHSRATMYDSYIFLYFRTSPLFLSSGKDNHIKAFHNNQGFYIIDSFRTSLGVLERYMDRIDSRRIECVCTRCTNQWVDSRWGQKTGRRICRLVSRFCAQQ